MSAVVIAEGVLEGLTLVNSLAQALASASSAVMAAQQTGNPVDYTGILGDFNTAEASVLSAIAAAKAAGK